jgi:basic amino acid/polyamine antiporter, APA family
VRSMGLWAATGIGVGAIVGGGIVVLGGVAVAEAGPAALLAFALNGAIAFLTAGSFAELATRFPENGGQYLYARRTFSVQAAFGVGWVMTFAHVVAAVLYALGFGVYAVAAMEALVPGVIDILPPRALRILTLACALGGTGYYLLRLLRGSAAGGSLENVLKLAAFGILIVAGVWMGLERGPADALAPLSPFFERGFTGVLVVMGLTFITLQGFELIAGIAGEVRDPERTVPRAMFLSLGIALAIYLPLLLVLMTVGLAPGQRPAEAAAGPLADTFFATAASGYLGRFGFWLVTVAALFSTLTALRANLLAASRVAQAMAGHRTLPRGLATRDPATGVPSSALYFVGAAVGVLLLVVPDLAAAGAAASLVFLVTFGITHGSAWQIRRRAGLPERGVFATPFFPAVPFLGLAACLFLVLFQLVAVPLAAGLLFLWLGFGLFIYHGFLSERAEALDAVEVGEDPLLTRLRGREVRVLVPVADPARAMSLASLGSALAPPGAGRVLLHQVILDRGDTDVRKGLEAAAAALGNAWVRTRADGVATELLLSVAPSPWEEIQRMARERSVDTVLLGMGAVAPGSGGEAKAAITHLLEGLPSDVAILHTPAARAEGFDLAHVRRVLVPLSGDNDHDRLRARLLGALGRFGASELTFLRVLPEGAPPSARRQAEAALRTYLEDEARGRGTVRVLEASAPMDTILEEARGMDLLILGITRPRGGKSRMGELLARLIEQSPVPVLLLSHPPRERSRWRDR